MFDKLFHQLFIVIRPIFDPRNEPEVVVGGGFLGIDRLDFRGDDGADGGQQLFVGVKL